MTYFSFNALEAHEYLHILTLSHIFRNIIQTGNKINYSYVSSAVTSAYVIVLFGNNTKFILSDFYELRK